MAADDPNEFLNPQNNNDDGGRDLGPLGRELAVTEPPPAQPIESRECLSGRLPSFVLERFDGMATSNRSEVEASKLTEILSLIPMPPSIGDAAREALYVKAIDLFESIGPADGIEGMLAAQMVGTHNATMECLRRAMIYNQSLEGQKVYLSQAARLMSIYTRHVDALAKHRGKARPNITVGQLNVESGGQAIVGNVEAARSDAASADAPPALEMPEPTPPVEEFEAATRRKVSR
jgi:hypothetical protein